MRFLASSAIASQVPNYLYLDLAGAFYPRSSEQYQELRYQLRSVLYNTLTTNCDAFDHM